MFAKTCSVGEEKEATMGQPGGFGRTWRFELGKTRVASRGKGIENWCASKEAEMVEAGGGRKGEALG